MSRFIGEDLNERQIAALQAVAYGTMGCQVCSENGLPEVISAHRKCWAIEDIDMESLGVLLGQLEEKDLVERTVYKEKPHVGLTDDGRRCNLIDVL